VAHAQLGLRGAGAVHVTTRPAGDGGASSEATSTRSGDALGLAQSPKARRRARPAIVRRIADGDHRACDGVYTRR
jgi:hypothetical protein